MRILLRAIIIFIIIFLSYSLFIYYGQYTPKEQHQEEKVQIANEIASEEKEMERKQSYEEENELPTEGILSLMNKSSEEVTAILGEPDRIDPSAYDYDWWIYEKNENEYIQVGIHHQKVVTVYGIGPDVNVDPFKIGQSSQEVFSIQPITSSLSMELAGNSYKFEFSEEDMNTRPTIKYGEVYVQLYIDKFDGILSSVRVLDAETFVKQRSYEVTYRGSLLKPKEISEEKWENIESGAEKQIFSITNYYRKRHGLPVVKWHEDVSDVAFLHSEDMKVNQYFSHVSDKKGNLMDRLARAEINYQMAGENIAAQYVDGIAASEGWLNSQGHREALLNEDFSHLGVGVDELYYTQNFIKTWEQ